MQNAGDDEPPSLLDTENLRMGQVPRLMDPHLQGLLNPNTSSSESNLELSSLEKDGSRKKRKAKKLKEEQTQGCTPSFLTKTTRTVLQ